MKIALGCDHGGFEQKEEIKKHLLSIGHEVRDFGCEGGGAVDYPDYGALAARAVGSGECEKGILICKSGVGMDIVANKVKGVRAALCLDEEMARLSRLHNDANVLVLAGSRTSPADAVRMADLWLETAFEGGRHGRRVEKIALLETGDDRMDLERLKKADPEVGAAIVREIARQSEEIELIASENFTSLAVLQAMGSVMTNKYAEGYPGKRYYDGCENMDTVEDLARSRACELFGAEHANVQPHSGTQANMAVYFAVLSPGDTILSMDLAHGGHLSMGHPVSFSGALYKIVSYGVRRDSELIDYEDVEKKAKEQRPKLIIAGASAYPRVIEYERFARIARDVGAYFMVDMAHIAGLVAAGCHPSPVPHADFVTTTTHKTLRGPRGGLILCRGKYARDIDRAVFPCMQGGPLMHVIAAKAVALHEAGGKGFAEYQRAVVRNASVLARELSSRGFRIVSGGTDNHIVLIDLTSRNLTGKEVSEALHSAGITVNKNMIPFDARKPFLTSGIRLGTPAVTTRGMGEAEMKSIAGLIARVVDGIGDAGVIEAVKEEVRALCRRFPLDYGSPLL